MLNSCSDIVSPKKIQIKGAGGRDGFYKCGVNIKLYNACIELGSSKHMMLVFPQAATLGVGLVLGCQSLWGTTIYLEECHHPGFRAEQVN